jgi:gamma-butyrobetaine dioxygenase
VPPPTHRMGAEPALPDDPVALIERLFAGPIAGRRFGEPVSVGHHMGQTAALAQADHASSALVVAALLHDVAYLIEPDLTDQLTFEADHAALGAAWLQRWFPPSVCEPVRLHVDAKRYLAATEDGYRASLSDESVRTLELQGGVMTPPEARQFERAPHFGEAVQLRRWDERGKDPRATTPPIEHYRTLIRSVGGGD